jgi:hypothetical protein
MAFKAMVKSCFKLVYFIASSFRSRQDENFSSAKIAAIESTLFIPPDRSSGSPPMYLK